MRGGVGSIAIKIASTGLNLILAIVLARLLGAEGFGVYSFIFALVTILAIPAQMGLPNLVVRETAKAQVVERWDVIRGLWQSSTLVSLAMSLVLMMAGALAAWIFADMLPKESLPVLFWGLVLVPLVALGNLRGAALRGLGHTVLGQFPEFILRPVFLVAVALLLAEINLPRQITAPDAMISHVIAAALAFCFGAYILYRRYPPQIRDAPNNTSNLTAWIASALPLAAINAMYLITDSLGILFLGIFSTSSDAGLFRVAFQVSSLLTFGLASINIVIAPYISREYRGIKTKRIVMMLKWSMYCSILFALPVLAIIVIYGQAIVELLLGPEFVEAYAPLLILSFGGAVNAFIGSASVLLSMASFERHVLVAAAASCALNFVLCLVLVPSQGLIGAAAANAISVVIWNGSLIVLLRNKVGIRIVRDILLSKE